MALYSLCSALLLTRAHRVVHYIVENSVPFGTEFGILSTLLMMPMMLGVLQDLLELQKECQSVEKQHQLDVNKLNQEVQQARTLHNTLQAQSEKVETHFLYFTFFHISGFQNVYFLASCSRSLSLSLSHNGVQLCAALKVNELMFLFSFLTLLVFFFASSLLSVALSLSLFSLCLSLSLYFPPLLVCPSGVLSWEGNTGVTD